MGQGYLIVNLDKKEYIDPQSFGNGVKLTEFGYQAGTMMALAALLSDGNGEGGGDLHSNCPLIGTWAGDRIVVAGDYGKEGKFVPNDTLANTAAETFKDISMQMAAALAEDEERPLS